MESSIHTLPVSTHDESSDSNLVQHSTLSDHPARTLLNVTVGSSVIDLQTVGFNTIREHLLNSERTISNAPTQATTHTPDTPNEQHEDEATITNPNVDLQSVLKWLEKHACYFLVYEVLCCNSSDFLSYLYGSTSKVSLCLFGQQAFYHTRTKSSKNKVSTISRPYTSVALKADREISILLSLFVVLLLHIVIIILLFHKSNLYLMLLLSPR